MFLFFVNFFFSPLLPIMDTFRSLMRLFTTAKCAMIQATAINMVTQPTPAESTPIWMNVLIFILDVLSGTPSYRRPPRSAGMDDYTACVKESEAMFLALAIVLPIIIIWALTLCVCVCRAGFARKRKMRNLKEVLKHVQKVK